MAASVSDIRRWFEAGVTQGATHMIVVCDTFDYEDFPVYVMPNEDVHELVAERRQFGSMSVVMEVYNLALDKDEQLIPGTRVWNY
jgi:hypothetical protein